MFKSERLLWALWCERERDRHRETGKVLLEGMCVCVCGVCVCVVVCVCVCVCVCVVCVCVLYRCGASHWALDRKRRKEERGMGTAGEEEKRRGKKKNSKNIN